MSGLKKLFFTGFMALLASACSNSSDGDRSCLGNFCGTDPFNSDDTNVTEPTGTSGSGTFTCSVVADVTAVRHQEEFGATIQAQGKFTSPVEITQGSQFPLEPFYSAIKIFGSLNNTGASAVARTMGAQLKDASGRTATCTTQVTVYPANATSSLACDIVPSNQAPLTGERVDFRFIARGGNGTISFSEFSPYSGVKVADSYLTKVSDTEYKASYAYTTPTTRFASVVIKSGIETNICRTPIFVGGGYPTGWDSGWDWSYLPPWFYYGGFFPPAYPPTFPGTPVNSCDITLTPSPGIAGTLTNLRVTVPSYVGSGPFEITSLSAVNLDRYSNASELDDLPAISRPSTLERKIRFRDPGQHRLTVNYRNPSTGATGSCQALHLARAAAQVSLSPGANEDPVSFTPSIRTFRGASFAWDTLVSAPDTEHSGARVAWADVNGDGRADLIIGAGRDTNTTNGVTYRVIVRDGNNLANILHDFNPLPSHSGGNGGVFVAGGDLNADGKAEIIIGQDTDYGVTGNSWVKVYNVASGTHSLLRGFQPYAGNYGVRLAVGDVNGDGYSDIITAPGKGGGAVVKIWSGRYLSTGGRIHSDLNAMKETGDATLASGLFVAAGDVDGDGKADIVAALDAKESADTTNYRRQVRVYKGSDLSLHAYTPSPFGGSYNAGIRVGAADLDGDGRAEVLVAPGASLPTDGFDASLRIYDFGLGVRESYLVPFWWGYDKGIFVGGGAGGL